jgi:hypothetical protein
MTPASISVFVGAHLAVILAALYVLSNVAVAVTPKRYQTEKWYGLLLMLARWAGTHVHSDEFGTLKLPFTNIVLNLGASSAPAAPEMPDAAAKPPSDPDTTPTIPPRNRA